MIKYFLKTFLGYGAIRVLAQIVSFCLIPVYTTKLFPEEYSAIEYVGVVNAILLTIIGMQLGQAAGRLVANKTSKKEEQLVISTGFWFTLGTLIICVFLLSWIFKIYDYQFFFTKQFKKLFFFNQVLLILNGLYHYLNVILTWKLERRKVIIANSVYIVCSLLSTIYFVVLANMHIMGSYYSMILSNILVVFILLYYTKASILRSFDFTILKKMFAYSYPLALTILAMKVWHLLDRRFILSVQGESILGIYALALKFAGPIILITGIIESILLPMVLKKTDSGETRKFLHNLFRIHFAGLLMLVLFVICFGKFLIPHFVASSFHSVQDILVYVLIAQTFLKTTYFAPGFIIAKNNKPLMTITFLFAILNYTTNVCFLSDASITNIILVNCLYTIGFFITLCLASERLYKISLPITSNTTLIILTLLLNQYLAHLNLSLMYNVLIYILSLILLTVLYRKPLLKTMKYLHLKRKGRT